MTVLAHRIDGPPGAPVLVLLGSIGSTTAMWDPLLGELAARRRVVRIDHRGHGASAPSPPRDAPTTLAELGADVLDTLDVLGIRRAELAGVSLGAMIGLWLAIERPARVSALAAVCTSAHLTPASNWTDRAATARTVGMAPIADATPARWLSPAGLAAHAETVRAMVGSVDPESYAQCCEAIASMDLRADLARIGVATVVVAGELDAATPPPHGRLIADTVPHALFTVVPGASHVPTWELPGVLAGVLLDAGAPAPDPLAAGTAVRRAVLGDAHVERARAATTDFTRPFQELITRYAWGDVWTRPGLSRRERSIATLSALTVLGAENEIGMHVRAALTNGLTREQIAEVLLHSAVYGGVPRANSAFAIAQRVLDELDAGDG